MRVLRGPAARMRQLYVNSRLSRCCFEYTRFKDCMIDQLNPDQIDHHSAARAPPSVAHTQQNRHMRPCCCRAAACWRQHNAQSGAAAASTEEPEGGLRPDITQKTEAATACSMAWPVYQARLNLAHCERQFEAAAPALEVLQGGSAVGWWQ